MAKSFGKGSIESLTELAAGSGSTETPPNADSALSSTAKCNSEPQGSQPVSESPDGGISRRSFLGRLGVFGAAVGAASVAPVAHAVGAASSPATEGVSDDPQTSPLPGQQKVKLLVNGKSYTLLLEPRVTLLDALRENLHLTGTKKGCDHGQCGACTVHVNGRRINSCLSFAVMHVGDHITTIEGLGSSNHLHPMQESFVRNDGYQCGYCTSGQIMSAVALMKEPCGKSDAEVREAMSGNICRCGAYKNILASIQQVRGNGAGLEPKAGL